MGNFSNEAEDESPYADSEDSEIVVEAKKAPVEVGEYEYTERDVALYNLGIGATAQQVKYTFEGDEDFQAIPTFGVIPQFAVSSGITRESSTRSVIYRIQLWSLNGINCS
jgi:multifunctional beta-oxidation protein